MPSRILIKLSLPPPELAPNARVHWAKKKAFVKAYRHEAFVETRQAQNAMGRTWPLALGVICNVSFVYSTNRRRDADNLIASLKSAFDGIVDAGVLADDSTEHLSIRTASASVDVGISGRVIVLIELLEP